MKCFLSSGYTEEPQVLEEIVCDRGPALTVIFRNLPITSEDKIEVVVCPPGSDVYMTSTKFQQRTIGTNQQTGKPLRGIVVTPPYANKPFPPGTKVAVVRAQPSAEVGAEV